MAKQNLENILENMTVSELLNRFLDGVYFRIDIDNGQVFGNHSYEEMTNSLRKELVKGGYYARALLPEDELNRLTKLAKEIPTLIAMGREEVLKNYGTEAAEEAIKFIASKLKRTQGDRIRGYESFLNQFDNEDDLDSVKEGFIGVIRMSLDEENESFYNKRMQQLRGVA